LADFGVIADVSETMRVLLTQALSTLQGPPTAEISDLVGPMPLAPARLTIYLFDISEDMASRNRPRVRISQPPDISVRKPPMALLLRYLLTPWSSDRLTDERMLGRAMQVFYDNAIIAGSQLLGGLAGSSDCLRVTLAPLGIEERSYVWQAIQQTYRVSLTYEVRVVNLDSETDSLVAPISRRTNDSGQIRDHA
jgi:Pvc16 N-terminal domain